MSASSSSSCRRGGDELELSPQLQELSGWTEADWKEYSDAVCDAFTARIQQFLDEREMRGGGLQEAEADGEDEDADGLPQLGPQEETEAALIIRSFTSAVCPFLEARLSLSVGMDAVVLSALSALSRVCQHAMSHSELLSSDAVLSLLWLFPDLAAISSHELSLWLQHQRSKVTTLLQRVVSQHAQQAAEAASAASAASAAAASPFAASALDLFTILSGTATGYFSHVSRLLPHGLSTFSSFLLMVDECICQYSRQVLLSCGSLHRGLIPRGDDDFKLKQSCEQEPSLLSKKAATIQSLTGGLRLAVVERAAKSSTVKAAEEMSSRGDVDADEPSSVASHSLPELCLHLSSLQACMDMMHDLQTQIRGSWLELCRQQPTIRQTAQRMAEDEPADHQQPQQQSGAAAGRRHPAPPLHEQYESVPHEQVVASGTKLVLLQSVGHLLFPSASAQLYADRKRCCELLSAAVVFIDWRQPLLLELYNPGAADGPRVVGGALLDAINTRMPVLYSQLQPAVFPVLCEQLLSHLCVGLQFVVTYGRRVIEQQDVQAVLLPDILAVELLFADELSALTVESCVHDYRRLLSVVGKSTEALLAAYADYPAAFPVSRQIIARILGLRRGSLIANFIKTERRLQKQRQQQQQHNGSSHSQHASFPSSSLRPPPHQLEAQAATARLPPSHAQSSVNPFAEEADGESQAEAGWELVRPPSPAPPLPAHAPQAHAAAAASVPFTSILASNSTDSSSSSSASASASASLRSTQRLLRSRLSQGLRTGRSIYGKIKAKAT